MFKIEPERSKKRKTHTTSSDPTHTISNLLSHARALQGFRYFYFHNLHTQSFVRDFWKKVGAA